MIITYVYIYPVFFLFELILYRDPNMPSISGHTNFSYNTDLKSTFF